MSRRLRLVIGRGGSERVTLRRRGFVARPRRLLASWDHLGAELRVGRGRDGRDLRSVALPGRAAHEQSIYKGQSVLETRFPFLKDSSWADVLFLMLPHRVEALGYVFLLALLVWSIWERRVRANLRESADGPFRDWNGTVRKNLTAMVCLHMLRGIKAVRVMTAEGWSPWQLGGQLKPEQERVLRLSRRHSARPDAVVENRGLLA